MGIKGLMAFLRDNAPKSVKETTFEGMNGRTLAIDASINLYQFIAAIRDGQGGGLQNEAGEITSHISGFLSRTIRVLEAGAKPVYVFDGKAPDLKQCELDKRREMRDKNDENIKAAEEGGDLDMVKKLQGRGIRVTRKQNEDVKVLLRLMGVPVIESPCEAEAQCAELTKGGKVFGAATEDLDSLTFGSTKLIRNLFAPEAKKKPIWEVDLAVALEQLNVTMDQFIDFCILSGCDYCDTIKGVGPQTSIRYIIEHGTIEKIVENVELKEPPTKEWLGMLNAVRDCFKNHEVTPCADVVLDFTQQPDYEGLKKFLIEDNQFAPERVARYCERLQNARKKKAQMRLDQFFKKAPTQIKESDKFNPNKKRGGAKAKAKAGAVKKMIKK